jgi:hypothetical protein
MRRSTFRIPVVGAALAVALSALPARANGRFPRAQHLIESPSDPNRLVIAATFGLLTTSDRGKNWYHICERAFSFQDNYGGDPLLALTADESMLVGVESSLNVSHDHGCQWAPSLQAAMQTIGDFTIAKSNADTVVAVVTSYTDGGTITVVNESLDGGKTYKTVGTPLPAQFVYSVDVDPKDPTHIYATALSKQGTGVFLFSSDHAMNWASSAIPNTNLDEIPYIAAIHPQDPKKIFVRTDAWTDRLVIDTANDALLYSDDGGKVWTELIRKGAKLLGFALSPDGSSVLAGYGDPIESAEVVDTAAMGIYKSATDSFMWTRLVDYSVTCLAWTKTGAYVCASQDAGFDLAFSQDASFKPGGCGLVPLLRRQEIKGSPPACAGAAVNMCDWTMACQVLDACDGGASPPRADDAASCVVGAGGSPGAGGAPGADASANGGGSAMTTGGPAGAATTGGNEVPKDRDSTGCSCRVPGSSSFSGRRAAWGALLLALVSCSRFGSFRTRRRRTRVAPGRR